MNLSIFANYGKDVQSEINSELERILTTSVLGQFGDRTTGATLEEMENDNFTLEKELFLKLAIVNAVNDYNQSAPSTHQITISFDSINIIQEKEILKIQVDYIPLGVTNVSTV